MTSNTEKESDIEKFQQFVFEMDDVLEGFIAASSEQGFTFDYSVSSLDALESYIEENIGSKEEINSITRVSRYLGEVFRKNLGGRWDLSLDDPKNINYKLPIINEFSELDLEFCPVAIIGNFVVSRKTGMIRKAVESNLEFCKKNLNKWKRIKKLRARLKS